MGTPKELKQQLKKCKLLLKKLEKYQQLKKETIAPNSLTDEYLVALSGLATQATEQLQIAIVGEKDNNIFANKKKLNTLVAYCKSIQGNKADLNNNPGDLIDFRIPASALGNNDVYDIEGDMHAIMSDADTAVFAKTKEELLKAFAVLKSTGGTHKEVVTALENAANAPLQKISDKLIKALEKTESLTAVRKRIKFPLVQNFFENTSKYKNGDVEGPNFFALRDTINGKYAYYFDKNKALNVWKNTTLAALDKLSDTVDSYFYYTFEAAKTELPTFLTVQLYDYTFDARFAEGEKLFESNVVKYLKTAVANLDFWTLLEQGQIEKIIQNNVNIESSLIPAISNVVNKAALATFKVDFEAWQKEAIASLEDETEVLRTNYHSCDFDGTSFKLALVNELANPAMSALIPVLPSFKYERKKANEQEFNILWAATWKSAIAKITTDIVLKQATEIVPFVTDKKWREFLPSADHINKTIEVVRSEAGITTDEVQDRMITRNAQKIAQNTTKLQELEKQQQEQAEKVTKLERLANYNNLFQKITAQLSDLVNYKIQVEHKLNQYILGYVQAKKNATNNLAILKEIANAKIETDNFKKAIFDTVVTSILSMASGGLIGLAVGSFVSVGVKSISNSSKVLDLAKGNMKLAMEKAGDFGAFQKASKQLDSAQAAFDSSAGFAIDKISSYLSGMSKKGPDALLAMSSDAVGPSTSLNQMAKLELASSDNFEEYSTMLAPFLSELLSIANVLKYSYSLMERIKVYEDQIVAAAGDHIASVLTEIQAGADKLREMVIAIDAKLATIQQSIDKLIVDKTTTFRLEYNMYIDTFNTINYNEEIVRRIFKDKRAKDFFNHMETVAIKANGKFPKANFADLLFGKGFEKYWDDLSEDNKAIPDDLKEAVKFEYEGYNKLDPRAVAVLALDHKDKQVQKQGELMRDLARAIDKNINLTTAKDLIVMLEGSSLTGKEDIISYLKPLVAQEQAQIQIVDAKIVTQAEAFLLLCKKDLMGPAFLDIKTKEDGDKFEQYLEMGEIYLEKNGGMNYYTALLKLKQLTKMELVKG